MACRALRILIVEDQLLIAKQLEVIALAAGHGVVGTATTAADACRLAVATGPDIVFLDISLAQENSGLGVASFLAENSGAQVVFTTANRRRLPPDFCGAVGVIEKPFTRNGVQGALAFMAARIDHKHNGLGEPASLVLSPAYRRLWTQPGA